MINGRAVLAIIPARGGSKGIPRKNIREIAGKPLIAWTIQEAKKSRYIDRLILSSEDDEIIRAAQEWGCEVPFIRPLELAQDETPGIEPVIHAVNKFPGYQIIVLLQPTSPLRTVADIDGTIKLYLESGAETCVSVTIQDKSPFWMFRMDNCGQLQRLLAANEIPSRRQETDEVYVLNGAVYVAEKEALLRNRAFFTNKTVGFVMPKERSLDIDDTVDFMLAEMILQKVAASNG